MVLEAAWQVGAPAAARHHTSHRDHKQYCGAGAPLHPELHIVARADSVEMLRHYARHGVQEVVQPEFEASLEMIRQALHHFDIPPTEIQKIYGFDSPADVCAPLRET